MSDAYMKVRDKGSGELELVRESVGNAQKALGVFALSFAENDDFEIIDNWNDGKYYRLDQSPTSINIFNPSSSTNYTCLYAEARQGDIFVYRGKGSSAARIFATLSSDGSLGENNVLQITSRYEAEEEFIFRIVDANAQYVVINADKRQDHIVYKKNNVHVIPSGADIDEILTPGDYYCRNATDRNALENVPDYITGAFRLKVENVQVETSTEINSVIQTITANTTDKRYMSISARVVYNTKSETPTFSQWYKIYDPNAVPLDILNSTQIPAESDLDDYTTPGAYYCNNASDSKTIAHVPLFFDSSFLLWVVNTRQSTDGANYKRQILFGNKTGTSSVYTRQKNAAGFGEWQLMINAADVESPMLLQASDFAPTARLTGTIKKTIRVGTSNVAHYWLQGHDGTNRDYLSQYPDSIAKWRNWLMKSNLDVLFLQECEDYIDELYEESAFNTLYKPFFDSDTNIDTNPGSSGASDKSRKKILNRLDIDTNADIVTITTDGESQYFTWCVRTIDGVGDVLLIDMHNFASASREAKRKYYLDELADFIESKNADYVIIAGDTNAQTDTDRSNLLAFCNTINAAPINGGILGWLVTAHTEETGRAFDNIIVSNNIRIESVECDPLLIPGGFIFSDHTPVTATISFM